MFGLDMNLVPLLF